jgi:16S rRNA (guanine966-N2)-methyltransferase
MRVVGGQWRGRPLTAPAGRATRPTSDKVREAVFDVLGALLPGGVGGRAAIDLFAGSGALGIEALSRGAASCTFVEHDARALRALRANLARVGLETAGRAPGARARVVATDVRRALTADARSAARYTLVFADPPYDRYAAVEPVLASSLAPLLDRGAAVVIETAAGTAVDLPWAVARVKRYGDTQVTFLAVEGPGPEQGAQHDDLPAG